MGIQKKRPENYTPVFGSACVRGTGVLETRKRLPLHDGLVWRTHASKNPVQRAKIDPVRFRVRCRGPGCGVELDRGVFVVVVVVA